jgi:hypothetical protein
MPKTVSYPRCAIAEASSNSVRSYYWRRYETRGVEVMVELVRDPAIGHKLVFSARSPDNPALSSLIPKTLFGLVSAIVIAFPD